MIEVEEKSKNDIRKFLAEHNFGHMKKRPYPIGPGVAEKLCDRERCLVYPSKAISHWILNIRKFARNILAAWNLESIEMRQPKFHHSRK